MIEDRFDKGYTYVNLSWVGTFAYPSSRYETRTYQNTYTFDHVPTEAEIVKHFEYVNAKILKSPDWSDVKIIGYAILAPTVVNKTIILK